MKDRLPALAAAARELFALADADALDACVISAIHEVAGGAASIEPLQSESFDDPLIAQARADAGSAVSTDGSRIVLLIGGTLVISVRAVQTTFMSDDLLAVELLAQYYAKARHGASLVGELDEQRNTVLELNQIKTDLIAMLAHDFKGPLTNILGYADLTSEVGEVNEHQQEYLESIKRAALRLSDLATDTLALSRLERNEVDLRNENVDLADLLQEVATANDRRRTDLDIEGKPVVRGDARRLRQVFYNLVENAIKYSPNGDAVKVRGFCEGNDAIVEVVDRGIGIPQSDVERIFDRFARGSNARRTGVSGTGFGLFLAKQIVELHGGRITVASREDRGSTFRVVLPLAGHEHFALPLRVAVLERRTESRSFIAHALREAGLRARLVHSLEALLGAERFEVDRIVVDTDGIPLDPKQRGALQHFALVHNAHLVFVGSNPPTLSGTRFLRKPYLMRELLAAVQATYSMRTGTE